MAIMREGDDRLTPDQFCYWFQGFAEIHGGRPTPDQWEIIKQHLELLFRPVAKSPKDSGVKPRPLSETETKTLEKLLAEKPPKSVRKFSQQKSYDTVLLC